MNPLASSFLQLVTIMDELREQCPWDKKQTMGAVDVIYGVTMQEPGVSKLVPVDFRSLTN